MGGKKAKGRFTSRTQNIQSRLLVLVLQFSNKSILSCHKNCSAHKPYANFAETIFSKKEIIFTLKDFIIQFLSGSITLV